MSELFRKLKQPSTIRALLVVAGLAGWNVSPENANAILTVLGLIYGVYEAGRDEAKPVK